MFVATLKEISKEYVKLRDFDRVEYNPYAMNVLLQICQLNDFHQVVISTYESLKKQDPENTPEPVIQRLYHTSLLVHIPNLSEKLLDLVKDEDYHLLFSIKCLIKAGFYKEAFTIFKEKIINDAIPLIMAERIKTFFFIILVKYSEASGLNSLPTAKEIEKFSETIKNNANYLI